MAALHAATMAAEVICAERAGTSGIDRPGDASRHRHEEFHTAGGLRGHGAARPGPSVIEALIDACHKRARPMPRLLRHRTRQHQPVLAKRLSLRRLWFGRIRSSPTSPVILRTG